MPYLWDDRAWQDYQYWQSQDKKTLRRINALLHDIARTGGAGIDKTELLKGSEHSLASARIDAKNRLVFSVDGDVVRVISCRGHYSGK